MGQVATRTWINRLLVVAAFLILAPAILAWEGVWHPYDHPALLKFYHYLLVWQPLIAGLLAILAAWIAFEGIVRGARITAQSTIEAAERTVAAATAKETARQKARDERERQEQVDIALDALAKLQALTKCLPAAVEAGEPQFLVTGAAAFPGLSTIRLNGVEMRIRLLGSGIAKQFAELEGWVAAIVADRDTKRDRTEFRNEGAAKRAEAEKLRDKIQSKLRFGG
jgi:hypothetical protein